jgi:hypothetical protein
VWVEHEFGVDALVEFGVALWGILTTASGTPPNCELRSRCLQRALNVDSGRLRRKDAAMVYIITNAPSKSSRSASQRREASKRVSTDGRIADPLKSAYRIGHHDRPQCQAPSIPATAPAVVAPHADPR